MDNGVTNKGYYQLIQTETTLDLIFLSMETSYLLGTGVLIVSKEELIFTNTMVILGLDILNMMGLILVTKWERKFRFTEIILQRVCLSIIM